MLTLALLVELCMSSSLAPHVPFFLPFFKKLKKADISSTFQLELWSCTMFSSHASDAEVSPAIPGHFWSGHSRGIKSWCYRGHVLQVFFSNCIKVEAFSTCQGKSQLCTTLHYSPFNNNWSLHRHRVQFTPWAFQRRFSVCSEELTLEEGFCGFLCVHSNFPPFHQSFHSLSGHECDLHWPVVSVTSLIGPGGNSRVCRGLCCPVGSRL